MANTPVVIPAWASCRTVSSRRSGRGARGSSARASRALSVPTLTLICNWLQPASSRSRSRSRSTRFDLVVMDKLKPPLGSVRENSSSVSRIARVTPNWRSAGW